MRRLIPLLAVFFIIRDGIPMTVTNLSQGEVEGYYGKSAIVDKPSYDAAVAAIPSNVKVADPVKDQAILDAKSKILSTDQRLDALIKVVGF